jgi:viologen exporter family transport system permease protein
MTHSIRRTFNIYSAIAAIVPQQFLAYSIWVWMQYVVQILSMTIFVYFWRAVFANTSTLGGLNLQQTLNYILLAQILMPVIETRDVFRFGFLIRSGQVAIELLRPLDFQLRFYVENLAFLAIFVVQKLPLFLIAWLVFGLQLPADPLAWGAFAISLILGQSALFFFDWTFACLAFYSTETWGLSVLRVGVGTFFSGALIPLTMMPGWLATLANALPFAQAIYIPISFFSGITPVTSAPQVWLIQLFWLVGLVAISRWVFGIALRRVTVQGG